MAKKRRREAEAEAEPAEDTAGSGLFPEDVVFEVLLRLPVKSVCRFRCVSPRWRAIISDPLFVSSHFDRSSARPVSLLFLNGKRSEYWSLHTEEVKTFLSLESPAENSDEMSVCYCGRCPNMGRCVYQSAGGLTCFDSSDGIHVCNPSTGDIITLRVPELGYFRNRRSSFLGYDPIEKKHKVFCSMESGAAVLTLGEKVWKKLKCFELMDLNLEESICIGWSHAYSCC